MIDLHSHVLPGVDDGAPDMAGSLAIARSAAEDGVTVLAATPHVRDDYPTTADTMERLLAEVQAEVAAAGIPITIVGGGELSLESAAALPVEELRRFGLGGNPRYLLVETPYRGWPLDMQQRLFELRTNMITPVLAHPERNSEVQAHPELLAPLVAAGTLVQVTAASLDGRLGRRARAAGLQLVQSGLAQLVASDAHAASVRQIGMTAAASAVGDAVLARWLTVDVPAAIVRGEPLPPRPHTRGPGLLARRLGR
jgi:protein-tyrosine phosphatase